MRVLVTINKEGKVNFKYYKRDGMAYNAMNKIGRGNPGSVQFAALVTSKNLTGPLSIFDDGIYLHNFEMTGEQSRHYGAKVKEILGPDWL